MLVMKRGNVSARWIEPETACAEHNRLRRSLGYVEITFITEDVPAPVKSFKSLLVD